VITSYNNKQIVTSPQTKSKDNSNKKQKDKDEKLLEAHEAPIEIKKPAE